MCFPIATLDVVHLMFASLHRGYEEFFFFTSDYNVIVEVDTLRAFYWFLFLKISIVNICHCSTAPYCSMYLIFKCIKATTHHQFIFLLNLYDALKFWCKF